MTVKNTSSTYGSVSKFLHWAMFLILLGMVVLGFYMHDLPRSPDRNELYGLHKSIGIIVLFLAFIRLVWRARNPIPELPADSGKLEKAGAHGAHMLLYLVMFILPISGWIGSSYAGFEVSVFGLFTMPDLVGADKPMSEILHEVHEILVFTLITLFVIHVAAAYFHHFVRKDDILKRMLPDHGRKEE